MATVWQMSDAAPLAAKKHNTTIVCTYGSYIRDLLAASILQSPAHVALKREEDDLQPVLICVDHPAFQAHAKS